MRVQVNKGLKLKQAQAQKKGGENEMSKPGLTTLEARHRLALIEGQKEKRRVKKKMANEKLIIKQEVKSK